MKIKKLLSVITTMCLAATVALPFTASAGSFVTGDSAGITYDIPIQTDASFEHPSLWENLTGSLWGGQSGLNWKITANDSSDGKRCLNVKATADQSRVAVFNRTPADWSSVNFSDEGWLNEFFFYADVKMSEDFVGSVYLKFVPESGNIWDGIANVGYMGECMIFDNTDKGLYATYMNNASNAGCVTPYAKTETKPTTTFTDWTRVSGLDYSSAFRYNQSFMESFMNNNAYIAVYVFASSGEIWVDNIGIWNFVEHNNGSNRLPAYDGNHTKVSTDSILINDMETAPLTYENWGYPYDHISYELDSTVKYDGNSSMKVTMNQTYTDGAYFYIDVPSSVTNQIDVSTKYHVEMAVKGAEGATVDMRVVINENERTSCAQMNYHDWNGEWPINGLGTFNNTPTFSVPTEWDLYSTGSFGVTGGMFCLKLQVRGTEGTQIWIDNITLVPDRIGESHGKVTATFNPETQKYTLTAVAEPGYVLSSLTVSAYDEYVPLIADKTDVLTTVYTPYSFGSEGSDDDVHTSELGVADNWYWPTVIANFVINDDPNLGDVNTDGDINILDLIRVKKYLVKAEGFEYEYFDMYNANLDDTDYVINGNDLVGLRQLLLAN